MKLSALSSLSLSALFATQLALAKAPKISNTVFLIRHGEKPSSGNGLDAQGEERAQCLTGVRISFVMIINRTSTTV